MNQIEHIMELVKKACSTFKPHHLKEHDSTMAELRAAIEQALAVQPKQEPVAWMYWQSCLNDDGTQTAPWVQRYSKFKPQDSRINRDVTPLYTAPQPQPEKRPQNCGTGFCSCIECPYSDQFPDAGKMMEPFGYFRSTLGGWEDCAETDEGARPLYEAPQPDHFADAGKPMERECEWHLDDEEYGIWESACGESWSFVDGGPAENRMMYCHRCGGKLREKNT